MFSIWHEMLKPRFGFWSSAPDPAGGAYDASALGISPIRTSIGTQLNHGCTSEIPCPNLNGLAKSLTPWKCILPSVTLWQPDLHAYLLWTIFWKPLWFESFDAAFVNKLVPCTWLSSGALLVWNLRLRVKFDSCNNLWSSVHTIFVISMHSWQFEL